MPITRDKKTELIEAYKAALEKSSAVVFTNYQGSTVAQVNALRAKLKETDTAYMVVKNTLLGIAFQQLERTPPETLLSGPNAVAFIGEDIGRGVAALKDLFHNAKIMNNPGAVV